MFLKKSSIFAIFLKKSFCSARKIWFLVFWFLVFRSIFVTRRTIAAQNTQELYLTLSESEDILQNVGQAEFENLDQNVPFPKPERNILKCEENQIFQNQLASRFARYLRTQKELDRVLGCFEQLSYWFSRIWS